MSKSDWYAGFKNRKYLFLFVFAIGIILSLLIALKIEHWIKNGRLSGTFSVMDLMMYWFKGILPVNIKKFETFELPEHFLFINICIATLIGNYVLRDLNGNGIQIITRVGKEKWFVSKVIWNVCTVLMVFLILFFSSYIVCILNPHGNGGFFLNWDCLRIMGYNTEYMSKDNSMVWLWIMPVVSMLLLAMVQMMISLIFSAVISYILVISQMVLSGFYISNLVPANGLMFIKSEIFYENGVSPERLILLSFIGWIAAVVIMKKYMNKLDILG